MKEFDYIIIGGGCAGLSLAYELEINEKLKHKSLAIIEPRPEYIRDKTWSFWKVVPHNFEDCVKKYWDNFSINIPGRTNYLECKNFPYQSIDSGLFYEKVNNRLKENKNISFFQSIDQINTKNSFIFNSVPSIQKNHLNLWQHFYGVEIETQNDCHLCPGFLHVKKNNLSDTLIFGSWGRFPDYKLIKSSDKEYLLINSDYMNGGVIESNILIFSTEESNFLEIIFEKSYISNEFIYYEDEDYSYEKIIRDFKFLEIIDNYVLINVDSSVWLGTDMNEKKTLKSRGSKKLYFLLN